ncbi:PLP-dependent transferase [Meredithblackwellia eburnea MCA 4105]
MTNTLKQQQPLLSQRGEKALARPPLLRCALFQNQYCPTKNPTGMINLGVAENSLMTSWLIDYFAQKRFALEYNDFTYGTALGGSLRLFEALQTLTTKYFAAKVPVQRDHVIAGSGCGSVIDLLVSCLADPGDGILVAKPYYTGFGASFECRNSVVPVGVELPFGKEAHAAAGVEAFEAALIESETKGVKIRAIMLCNPHNPLGFCYSKETLLAYCRFAEKYNIHLISDEIYALSTFTTPDLPDAQPFVSVLSLDPLAEAGCSPSRIHCIYGSSKDWSSNGLRIGALISQANEELHRAMESSCLLMKISSAADILWSGLLLDPVALPTYVDRNRALLAESYQRAVSFLKTHNIPYRKSNAGHFIFIDLRRFLPSTDAEGKAIESAVAQEEELYNCFMRKGVIVARGTAYCMPEAGWFRLTFTLRPDFFELGLQRFEKALNLAPTLSVDLKHTRSASTKSNVSVIVKGVQEIGMH